MQLFGEGGRNVNADQTKGARALVALGVVAAFGACTPEAPPGIAAAQPAKTTVKFDLFARHLPVIPLPNDLATRFDPSSATGRRINASMIAPTSMERRTRTLIDQLDGWGIFQPITIPFSGPLDVQSILAGHRDVDYDPKNDVVYVVNIDRRSPRFGQLQLLDVGNGNYPVVLEKRDNYFKNDVREDAISLLFEEIDEDRNGNGVLDPGEDTDADGVLDRPNYLPGAQPAPEDLAARTDALMTFYEAQTNTLILRLLEPLDERTTYAVVVTRRLKDAAGNPVGSPFEAVNHAAQTEALRPLLDVLPAGLPKSDIAFAFSFTTQSVEAHWKAVRDGLYGHGVQRKLAQDFPAELTALHRLVDDATSKQPHLMRGEEWKPLMLKVGPTLLGINESELRSRKLLEAIGYVDFVVMGSFDAPQLFDRVDKDGKPLPLDAQSWPPDLDRKAAPARAERVHFTLVVPRKEVSVRKDGKPAPVVIVGHGYGGSRLEALMMAPYLAKRGLAVLGIDGPSHGLGASTVLRQVISGQLEELGMRGLGDALLSDRTFDQNGDGDPDPGADMWSAYVFHTRDMVRQFALDYAQLVRILRGFDGTRRWAFDTNGDGQPDLAGDFDGDGVVDVGLGSTISMTGGSLGGIMSMVMGGAEPEITSIAPVAGGAGYLDIGIRSAQGGVPEAFALRVMGPLYVGTLDATTGELALDTVVPDLNKAAVLPLGSLQGVAPGDLLVAENLANGERGCGFVDEEGHVRAGVASDVGDRTRLLVYRDAALVLGEDCELPPGHTPIATFESVSKKVATGYVELHPGDALTAVGEGLGLRRNDPGLRRMRDIAQLVLDPGDPVAFARGLSREPIHYATGSRAGHALVITTMGDMNVPASSGVTYGRAAGLIDYRTIDPRYGKPQNQVLLDTHTAEAVDTLRRYTDPSGSGVHLDVENFSGGADIWTGLVPRLEPPLHIGIGGRDAGGGQSAAIFPMTNLHGQHGFDMPGAMIDGMRKACSESCGQAGADPCQCEKRTTFDIGSFMQHMIGGFFASNGTEISTDLCMSRDDCPGFQPPPAPRPAR